MGAMAITIGSCKFPSKTALTQYVRSIVARYSVGQTVNEADFKFLCDLFIRHPHWALKSERGIQAVKVVRHKEWARNKALLILDDGGAEIDISWSECISPTPRRREFMECCRAAVVEDILRFKKEWFDRYGDASGRVRCAATGTLVGWRDAHIDHAQPTFVEIVENFCKEFAMNPARVKFAGYEPGSLQLKFESPLVIETFRKYHREVATLRVISAKANLSRKRGKGAA